MTRAASQFVTLHEKWRRLFLSEPCWCGECFCPARLADPKYQVHQTRRRRARREEKGIE